MYVLYICIRYPFLYHSTKFICSLHPSFLRKSCFQATVPGPTVQAANIDQYNSDLWESGELHNGHDCYEDGT